MVDPVSMRKYTRERVNDKKLNDKEKELYAVAFYLYNDRGYGREYLRQLVTIACIDADEAKKARPEPVEASSASGNLAELVVLRQVNEQ